MQVTNSLLLRGKKVILREKRLDDAAKDYTWLCDSELARLDAASPMRISFREFLADYTEEMRFTSRYRRRFAIDTIDGEYIGNVMYYDIDEGRGEAELGIMIGNRTYWSKGYGTCAITTLLEHIFSATSLKRIYLNTLDWNVQAQKCFEKCGFVSLKRVKRHNGTFVVMEVRRDLWLANNGKGLLVEEDATSEAD